MELLHPPRGCPRFKSNRHNHCDPSRVIKTYPTELTQPPPLTGLVQLTRLTQLSRLTRVTHSAHDMPATYSTLHATNKPLS